MKKIVFTISVMLISLAGNSMAGVKYDNLVEGDNLYTRGTSKDCKTGWINRLKVTSIIDGVAWGTWEQAMLYNMNFRTLDFESKNTDINLTKPCKSGGCYTSEEEAFADVKFMLVFGYCGKSIHRKIGG